MAMPMQWAKIGSRFRSTMRVRSRISELCQCMGIINTLSKLQILIFIIRIGNLLISSLYGATETSASWFEMAFKRRQKNSPRSSSLLQ